MENLIGETASIIPEKSMLQKNVNTDRLEIAYRNTKISACQKTCDKSERSGHRESPFTGEQDECEDREAQHCHGISIGGGREAIS